MKKINAKEVNLKTKLAGTIKRMHTGRDVDVTAADYDDDGDDDDDDDDGDDDDDDRNDGDSEDEKKQDSLLTQIPVQGALTQVCVAPNETSNYAVI